MKMICRLWSHCASAHRQMRMHGICVWLFAMNTFLYMTRTPVWSCPEIVLFLNSFKTWNNNPTVHQSCCCPVGNHNSLGVPVKPTGFNDHFTLMLVIVGCIILPPFTHRFRASTSWAAATFLLQQHLMLHACSFSNVTSDSYGRAGCSMWGSSQQNVHQLISLQLVMMLKNGCILLDFFGGNPPFTKHRYGQLATSFCGNSRGCQMLDDWCFMIECQRKYTNIMVRHKKYTTK